MIIITSKTRLGTKKEKVRRNGYSRRVLWTMLVLHFNIGKSKLSALPMTIRLVWLAGLIAFALMELNRTESGNMNNIDRFSLTEENGSH